MGCNPCPCVYLQTACKVLATIDALLNMLSIGLLVLAIILYVGDIGDGDKDDEEAIGMISSCIILVVCILRVRLAFHLYTGATNRSIRKCTVWLMITGIATVIVLTSMIINVSFADIYWTTIGGSMFTMLYNLFEMLVVLAFLQELRIERATRARFAMSADRQIIVDGPPPPPSYFASEASVNVYVVPPPPPYSQVPLQNPYTVQQYTYANPSYAGPDPDHLIETSTEATTTGTNIK